MSRERSDLLTARAHRSPAALAVRAGSLALSTPDLFAARAPRSPAALAVRAGSLALSTPDFFTAKAPLASLLPKLGELTCVPRKLPLPGTFAQERPLPGPAGPATSAQNC